MRVPETTVVIDAGTGNYPQTSKIDVAVDLFGWKFILRLPSHFSDRKVRDRAVSALYLYLISFFELPEREQDRWTFV
jgi:hypothetical protein